MSPALNMLRRPWKPPRPNLRAVYYRDRHAPTFVVFEAPAGVTTRSAVELVGVPRFFRVGAAEWKRWPESAGPSWARAWGAPKQLDGVPNADPDSVVLVIESPPVAFEVGASTWCSWPAYAREALRVVTSWTKAPGVMRTDALDGATAERVRNVASQHTLAGLEERAETRSFGYEPTRSATNHLDGGRRG